MAEVRRDAKTSRNNSATADIRKDSIPAVEARRNIGMIQMGKQKDKTQAAEVSRKIDMHAGYRNGTSQER